MVGEQEKITMITILLLLLAFQYVVVFIRLTVIGDFNNKRKFCIFLIPFGWIYLLIVEISNQWKDME